MPPAPYNNKHESGGPAKSSRQWIVWLIILAAITVAAFLPALQCGFTNWDDDRYVTANDDIKSISLNHIAAVFSKPYVGNYQPFAMLTYMLDYALYQLHPAGYHLTNLLFHMLNVFLVFALIYALSGNPLTGFLGAALFAIHPLRVESVAWIAERKDVTCSFFFLASLLAYVLYRKRGRTALLFLSGTLFVAAVLSKPMAVTLPLVLLLVDYLMVGRFSSKLLMEKLPFFAVSIICAAATYIVQQHSGFVVGSIPFMQHVAAPFFGFLFYLLKTIAPVQLSTYYPFEGNAALRLSFLYPVISILLLALAFWSFRRSRPIVFGLAFFLITLLPVLQIVKIGGAIVADRYTYLPVIGLCFAIADPAGRLLQSGRISRMLKCGAVAIFCAVLITLGLLTWQRCGVWKNSLTLWDDVLAKYPSTGIALHNRGTGYMDAGNYPAAIADLSEAIRLQPGSADHYFNRALCYLNDNNFNAAVGDLTIAVRLDPQQVNSWNNRGCALLNLGRYDEAMSDFSQALALNPGYASARNNLDRAVQLKSVNCFNRGIHSVIKREYDSAISDFTAAIQVNPQLPNAYFQRGVCYCVQGRFDQGIGDFDKAIALNPSYAEAVKAREIAMQKSKKK